MQSNTKDKVKSCTYGTIADIKHNTRGHVFFKFEEKSRRQFSRIALNKLGEDADISHTNYGKYVG